MKIFSEAQKKYKTHFTDTFVIATAQSLAYNSIIVTADHAFDRYKEENPNNVIYFR